MYLLNIQAQNFINNRKTIDKYFKILKAHVNFN